MPFADDSAAPVADPATATLPIQQYDYFKLVDATGRIPARGKRGHIVPALTPILERLGMTETQWTEASSAFRQHYRNGGLGIKQTA